MKFTILFFFLYSALFSQLSIKVNQLTFDEDYNMNAEINLKYLGNNVTPNIDNILILEQNKSNSISKITPLQDGNVLLTFKPVYSVIRDPRDYVGTLIINYNNAVAKADLNYTELNTPRIIFTNTSGLRIETMDFGIVPAGQKRIRQVFMRTNANRSINGNIVSTKVESISVDNPNFTATWDGQLGGIGNPQPPLAILPSVNYLITFVFQSDDDKPQSAVFTLKYDNGAKAEILFTANNLKIKEDEVDKLFNVLTPNGGEKLSPCLDVPVVWEGNTNGFNTKVDYSSNNGASWNFSGYSTSSTYLWDVPKEVSDSVKIRISQEFKALNKIVTNTGADSIIQMSYSLNDNLIKIFSSKVINLDLNGNFYLGNSVQNLNFFGTGFLSEDKFIIGINSPANPVYSDSILIYSTSQQFPISRIATNVFPIKQLKTNQKTGKYYIFQEFGNKVYEYDETGLLDSIQIDGFISSISLSNEKNQLSVVSYNGDINIFDLNNKQNIKSFKIKGTPYLVNSAISENGKILALGAKINDVSKEAAFVYLTDIESGSIFKVFEVAASDPISLAFNPNSTILVIVSKWSPQILVWDLIGDKAISGFGGTNGEVVTAAYASSKNTLSLSSRKPNELTNFTLMFPLYDESDSTFRIIDPIISSQGIDVTQELIFGNDSVYFKNQICNNGEVDFVLDNYWFSSAKNYSVKFDKYKDTLSVGECASFYIYFKPQDIGTLDDSLIVSNSCNVNLTIPITGVGLPRNIEYFADETDLGTICVTDSIFGSLNLIKNLDTLGLDITDIEIVSSDAIFSIQNSSSITLNLNDTLKINYFASPLLIGENKIKLRVYYNNQKKYYFEIDLVINGIGSTLQASHDYITFIKGENNRVITIKNQYDKPVEFNGYRFIPDIGYKLKSNLPSQILPSEEIQLEFEWDTTTMDSVRFVIDADPCPLGNKFILLPYTSTNFLEIPDLVAKTPASDVSIPIISQDSPRHDYNGKRNFNLTINLNPRVFFPTSVTSKFGDAELISYNIENDVRKIKVNLYGELPLKDTLLQINGVSGIAETDTTSIVFDRNETKFGDPVKVSFNDGSLKILGLHGNRRVIHKDPKSVHISKVSPNPSSDNLNVEINSLLEENININIRNSAGQVVYESKTSLQLGKNQFNINKLNISSGSYYLELSKNNEILDSYQIKIIK